ncbi:C40 family peptidase [Actinomadura alba]|uniref:C40 family peptidase n=1 Tax=Actinomadura alba TaxID=406431 RepID=A0ABR7M3C2_9ACTN|nr:C40 family peptidase [Actinomadura alba]MBC6471314.1 C40 family peptidase [Actinomadura alba]
MERRRVDGRRQGAPRRGKAVATWSISAAVTLTTVLPMTQASAEPTPSRRELTAQQEKLADQAEQLTEQYNGLRVRLQQAERAAKIAKANAVRQQQALEEARAKVAQVAADSYKNGGVDPTITLATSTDPQALLDRSATLNYFAEQNGTHVSALLQTMQAATRARKAAEQRADQVNRLTGEARRKQRSVQKALSKVESKLGTGQRSTGGPIPNIAPGSASAKALGAVEAALARLGTPYSWGGGGPSGPTFGVAQGANIKGFDCSGLTLFAYAQVGISLPHYTGSQFNAGTRVTRDQLRPGDLVFFHTDLHHMGMYIGNGKMVHAPQTGDVVKISPLTGRPWAGAVRIA